MYVCYQGRSVYLSVRLFARFLWNKSWNVMIQSSEWYFLCHLSWYSIKWQNVEEEKNKVIKWRNIVTGEQILRKTDREKVQLNSWGFVSNTKCTCVDSMTTSHLATRVTKARLPWRPNVSVCLLKEKMCVCVCVCVCVKFYTSHYSL